MALPLGYSWRNLLVRRTSTLFTALGIALTVAVFCGVFALRNGFQQLYTPRGEEDIAIYLRPGANSEGESAIRREQANIIIKERSEILRDPLGIPIAAAESYLAVYMEKLDGGLTNVPLRGVQRKSFDLLPTPPQIVEGRMLSWGSNEVLVGQPLTSRMRNCQVGDTLTLNLTPFEVVGVFTTKGAAAGEVWGDVDRMMEALERPVFQRVIARVDPNADLNAISEALREDARTPLQVLSEREYLAQQTSFLSAGLLFLALFLTVIMGLAAVLGAMNTMLSSVSARTHEIGVLKAIGYKPPQIFGAFVFESALIGLVGGLLGLLIVLPFHGIETGATNWNTFTDVSFSFTLSPQIAATAFLVAFALGLIGGALPAWRAARLRPVDALRTA